MKGFIKIASTVLVVVVVGVVGYFALRKSSTTPVIEQPITTQGPTANNTLVNTNESVTTSTEGWKTYKDDRWGLQFQYPPNWIVHIPGESQLDFQIDVDVPDFLEKQIKDAETNNGDEFNKLFYGDANFYSSISLNVANHFSEEIGIDESEKELQKAMYSEHLVFTSKKEMTINNYPAVRLEWSYNDKNVKIVYFIFMNRKLHYSIITGTRVPIADLIEEHTKLFDKFVSTFEFKR